MLYEVITGWVLFHFTAHLKHEFRIAREGRENGDKLTAMFNDLEYWPTVAVITAGGNKLHYDGRVLDLMGLNWPEMAHAERQPGGDKNHSAFNREVFYRWMPDILLCGVITSYSIHYTKLYEVHSSGGGQR